MTQDEISALDPAAVAQAIGCELSLWPGNCYAIAYKMVQQGIVDGFAVYGHYYGPIAPTSSFAGKAGSSGIVRHGWIETSAGLLIDPTRFVFDACEPYIFCQPQAQARAQYDEGGERFRKLLHRQKAPPVFDPSAKQIPVPAEACQPIAVLVGRPAKNLTITVAEAFWIANLPYDSIAPDAATIYGALDAMGHAAFVPIDNFLRSHR